MSRFINVLVLNGWTYFISLQCAYTKYGTNLWEKQFSTSDDSPSGCLINNWRWFQSSGLFFYLNIDKWLRFYHGDGGWRMLLRDEAEESTISEIDRVNYSSGRLVYGTNCTWEWVWTILMTDYFQKFRILSYSKRPPYCYFCIVVDSICHVLKTLPLFLTPLVPVLQNDKIVTY